MTAVRQMRFVTGFLSYSLSLSLLSSSLASFSTWIDFQAPGYWHGDMRAESFKCTRNPTHGTASKQLPHATEGYMKAIWLGKVLSIHSMLKIHRRNCVSPGVVRCAFLRNVAKLTLSACSKVLYMCKIFTSIHWLHCIIKTGLRYEKKSSYCTVLTAFISWAWKQTVTSNSWGPGRKNWWAAKHSFVPRCDKYL